MERHKIRMALFVTLLLWLGVGSLSTALGLTWYEFKTKVPAGYKVSDLHLRFEHPVIISGPGLENASSNPPGEASSDDFNVDVDWNPPLEDEEDVTIIFTAAMKPANFVEGWWTTKGGVKIKGGDILPGEIDSFKKISDPNKVNVNSGNKSIEVEEGGASDDYNIRLKDEPLDDVTITVTADDQVRVNGSQQILLLFEKASWEDILSVTVTAVDDPNEEGSHHGFISHESQSNDPNYDGIFVAPVFVDIGDNECGGWGFLKEDFNHDCHVNIMDLGDFADGWVECTDPVGVGCVQEGEDNPCKIVWRSFDNIRGTNKGTLKKNPHTATDKYNDGSVDIEAGDEKGQEDDDDKETLEVTTRVSGNYTWVKIYRCSDATPCPGNKRCEPHISFTEATAKKGKTGTIECKCP